MRSTSSGTAALWPDYGDRAKTSSRCGGVTRSLREQLAPVRERLELQRVAGRVEQEHRGLFAGLALEAHVRFDHEARAGGAQFLRQRVPLVHVQHQAEVPDR